MNFTKKRNLLVLATGALITAHGAIADGNSFWKKKEYPRVYPFVPMTTSEIYNDVQKISEDKDFIKNFNDILRKRLSVGKSKTQPWTASYWPLAKGTLADPFEQSKIPYYVDFGRTSLWQWTSTSSSLKKRRKKVWPKIKDMTNEELRLLSPSEKYDLLLGDYSFSLTKKLTKYMETYGKDNKFGDLTGIVLAPEKGSANDSLKYAALSMKWNNYKSYYEAFKKDYVLKKRLDTQIATKLVDAGLYDNVVDAMEEALPQAKKEAKNYVLADKTYKTIAAWEGICNGWSTAAGLIPRPKRAIGFKLPDGRKLDFYPSDIKGLVSLYWVNSVIQNNAQFNNEGKLTSGGTILIGNRCNDRNPPKDNYGRLYDDQIDSYTGKLISKCAGVHPAKWHLGIVNVMGNQERSFIVERKVGHAVDNHPMSNYSMKYFNPYNGKEYGDINKNIEKITKKDQFRNYRNSRAKYVVGVMTTMSYMNYAKPNRELTNEPKDDEVIDKEMIYDLELDDNFDIVGGQWRAAKVGKPRRKPRVGGQSRGAPRRIDYNHNQPDFFWAVSKQWKQSGLFSDNTSIEKWGHTTQAPPKTWLATAQNAHDYEYKSSLFYGTARDCTVKNEKTGEIKPVFCEHSTNRPQPLINVLNVMINRSK